MNKKEVLQILNIIDVEYPTSRNLSESQQKLKATLWYNDLKDVPYNVVLRALNKYMIQGNAYQPHVGQIRSLIYEEHKRKLMSGEQAWAKVLKGASQSSYNRNFDTLPSIIQKTIGTPHYLKDLGGTNKEECSYMKTRFLKEYEKVSNEEFLKLCCGEITINVYLQQNEKPLLEIIDNKLEHKN